MKAPNSPRSDRSCPPLVSIIMPTHDRPAELRIAIQSVLEQSHENLELIVVNDGGCDVSSIISALNESSRIHYIWRGHSAGAAAARNMALSVAQGEYITYLDDDDWYDAEHVTTLVAALEQSGAAVAYSDSRRVVEQRDASQPGQPYVPRAVQDPYYSVEFSRDAFLVNNYIPILCVMHRRDCLDTAGMFDETLPVLEDWELWIRMSRHFDFLHVPKVTCTVRWRTDGTTTTTRRRREHWLTAQLIQRRYAGEVADRPELIEAQAQLLSSLAVASETHAPRCSLLLAIDAQTPHLRACIEAVAAGTRGVSYELVLALCGETTSHDEWLSSLTGDVRILRLAEGTGTVEAWQRAATEAGGDYLVILPADVMVRRGWLGPLLQQADEGASIVGGKLLAADGRVAQAGGRFDPEARQFEPSHRGAAAWSEGLRSAVDVEALGAQVVLIERGLFKQLGGLTAVLAPDSAVAELCKRCQGRVVLAADSVAYQAPAVVSPAAPAVVSPAAPAVVSPAAPAVVSPAAPAVVSPAAPTIDVADLRQRASDALKAGDLSTAEALLLDIQASAPDDGESWLVWGVLHIQRSENEKAERRFRGAPERGGDAVKSGTGVAIALSAMSRVEEAWEFLGPLADRYPNHSDVLHAVFRAGVSLGHFEHLRDRLVPYLEARPDDDDMRYALATVLLRLGDRQQATSHYMWLQQRVPEFAGLDDLAAGLASGLVIDDEPAATGQALA
jgi:glycosyltransferase involved in cell wall biosynthesis/Flp pilus assembly protein TadD